MLGVIQHLAIVDVPGHDDVMKESVNLLYLVCPDHVLKILTGGEVIGVHLRDPVVLTPRMEEQVLLKNVLHVPRLRRLWGIVHIPCQPHGGNEVMEPTLTPRPLLDSGSLNAWIFHDIEEPMKLARVHAELLRPVMEVGLLFHVITHSGTHGQKQVQDLVELEAPVCVPLFL